MVILGPWRLLRQTYGRAGIGGFIVVRKLVNHDNGKEFMSFFTEQSD
jgi:hypothetical protein